MPQNDCLPVEVKRKGFFLDNSWRQAEIRADMCFGFPMAVVVLCVEEEDVDDTCYYLIIGPPKQGSLSIRMGIKNPDEGWFVDVAGFDAYGLESIEDGDGYEAGDAISNALSYEDGEALVSALIGTKCDWLMIRKVKGINE